MRKILSLITVLLLASFLPMEVLAQSASSSASAQSQNSLASAETDQAVIRDVEGLRIKLVQQTQDPNSKDVRFDLVIFSQFASDRVQVTWAAQGGAEILPPANGPITLTVKNNGVLTTSAVVRPRVEKTSVQLQVRVEAFEAQGTYVATASKTFGIQSGLEVVPVTNEYRIAQFINIGRGLTVGVLVIFILIVGAIFGYMRFRGWLDRR